MRQLSFYSVDARPRAVDDLAGLLCGPGQAVRFGRGTSARLSLVVPDRWRVVALAAECAARGVVAELSSGTAVVSSSAAVSGPATAKGSAATKGSATVKGTAAAKGTAAVSGMAATKGTAAANGSGSASGEDPGSGGHPAEGWPLLRTAFRADLAALAAAWTRGAVKAVPAGFVPDGPVLRLWAQAAGRCDGGGYLLGLDPHAPDTHEPLVSALAKAGITAVLLGPRGGGPALRITGRRRLARLVELVGAAPAGAPPQAWPAD